MKSIQDIVRVPKAVRDLLTVQMAEMEMRYGYAVECPDGEPVRMVKE